MWRVIIPYVAVAILYAQAPQAAPEKATAPERPSIEVDAALRARVTQFYQYEIARKFYSALQLVAEDTRDYYVESNKSPYLGFQIDSIRYSDGFTKAVVASMVNRQVPVEGFIGHSLGTKMTTRWKLENGQWCFYVDPQDLRVTPFGPAPPGMFTTGGAPPPGMVPSPVPPQPVNQPPTKASAMPAQPVQPSVPSGATGAPQIQGMLGMPPSNIPRTLFVDKDSVQLKSTGASSGEVTISNPTPFPAALTVSYPPESGLTVKLDPPTIYPNQKATLSIQSIGGKSAKGPVTVSLKVQQTNQLIPISVSFAN